MKSYNDTYIEKFNYRWISLNLFDRGGSSMGFSDHDILSFLYTLKMLRSKCRGLGRR